jgi:bile acid-coenzyme A ligase
MATMSMGRVFTWLAAQDPERVAVRDHQRAITRAELDRESNRLARVYRDAGVGVDDLVTVGLGNGVAFFLACAAIWKAGGIPQPVSARLPAPDRRAIVETADPVLIVGADPADHPGRVCLPAGFEPPVGTSDAEVPDVHASSWKAPTSGGSTGRPKIILSGSPATVDPTRPTASFIPRDAVQLVSGPLSHGAPFIYAMRGLMTGHTVVVLPRFDPVAVLEAIERRRVTWGLLVPTMMLRIWRLPPDIRLAFDLSSIESILHLGAPCPPWLKRVWLDWLGPDRVVEVYAGTESQGVTVIGGREWLAHPGSVGRPAPGFRFSVLDDRGRVVPPGQIGQIHMIPARGPGSTYRYLGAEARLRDGWDSLGDLGWMDDEGYLYLADRRADVIISGAVNVYPAEVEAALDEHPRVRSSAVIGLPDDDLGERVHAVVDVGDGDDGRADPGVEDLMAWVADRLAASKVPRSVEIVHRPLRDDAGKVRRSGLRADRLDRPAP